MAGRLSLRASLSESVRFATRAWRSAPVGCGLAFLAFLVPTLVGDRAVPLDLAIPLALAQLALFVVGWTGLLRAAQGRQGFARIASDALTVLASALLNCLFLSLIGIVLGIVLLGVAGATGLSSGEDLTMAAQASVAVGGWQTLVLLALEIAAALLLLTLSARLLPAGPATVSQGRVVSLASLGWTRGTGLKPAFGLMLALVPSGVLVITALWSYQAGPWIDWLWSGVLGFVQFPLLAGYATGLWQSVRPEGDFQ